jgi:hypothetical protein
LLLLAISLFALTLIVPLWTWPLTNWRTALRAWWEFCRWMLCLYAFGFVVWLSMALSA